MQPSSKFVVGFNFNPGHEIHYLVNTRARTFRNRYSFDKADAMLFPTEAAAYAKMEAILDRGDRGKWGGYHYMSIVERADDN